MLKSLEEHDRERRQLYRRPRDPQPNGIACPKCGKELVDDQPDSVRLSSPPKKSVACLACGWLGSRIA